MGRVYLPLPPAEELWRQFDYHPLTGAMTWADPQKPSCLDTPAGWINNLGYYCVTINRQKYTLHRLIWAWVTGEDPGNMQIDHANMNRSDNHWGNLRLATQAQQGWNSGVQRNKRQTSLLGTRRCVTSSGRVLYSARIAHNKVRHELGYFDTEEQAHEAYCAAALELHGDFAKFG
jgi:hypothetical protein